MCFAKYSFFKPRVKIAKKDIVCYKHVIATDDPEVFLPLYYPHKSSYKLGTLTMATNQDHEPVTSLLLIKNKSKKFRRRWDIFFGIHAYLQKESRLCFKMLECVIPKGAEYVKNSYGVIVSTCIIPIIKVPDLI